MTGRTWPARTDLERETAAYQSQWWRADPAVTDAADGDSALAATLALDPPLVRTSDVYEPSGWARRKGLHDRLVARQLGRGPSPTDPAVFFTIGCMGAGKTTVLRPLVDTYRAAVLGRRPETLARVAADEIRVGLPEYADGLGSEVVAAEAMAVTYDRVYPAARDARLDIVYATIGRLLPSGEASFEANLLELRADGFRDHVLLVVTPFDVCVERAERRALAEDGRLVAIAAQEDVYDQPGQCLKRLLSTPGAVDEWFIVDGSGPPAAPPMLQGSDGWSGRYPEVLAHAARSAGGML